MVKSKIANPKSKIYIGVRSAKLEVLIYLFLVLPIFGCGLRSRTPSDFMQMEQFAPESNREVTSQQDIEVMMEAVRLKADDASDTWNLVAKCWSTGDIERAAEQMKRYMKFDPDNAEAHNIIGLDYYCKRLYNAALREFRMAAKLNPDEKQYSYNEALTLIRLDRYDEADQAFERATDLQEGGYLRQVYAELISVNRARKLYNDGCDAMENLDSTQAMDLFKAALKLRPDMVEAHVNLGVLYRMQGDGLSQMKHSQEAVRLKPDMPDAHYNLGLAYSDAKMHSQAIAEFKQAIELKPSFKDAHFNLGTALYRIENYTDAAAEFEKCLELSPNWFEAHLNLGTCYLKTGSVDGAIYHFDKAAQLRPDSAEAHYDLGEAHIRMERFDEASAFLQKALEIDPGYKQARIRLKELQIYQHD